jgi:hypothetical protein
MVLEDLDKALREVISKIDMLMDINKDFSSYKKYQKKLVNIGYKIAKLIQKIIFTDFLEDSRKPTKVLVSSWQCMENIVASPLLKL